MALSKANFLRFWMLKYHFYSWSLVVSGAHRHNFVTFRKWQFSVKKWSRTLMKYRWWNTLQIMFSAFICMFDGHQNRWMNHFKWTFSIFQQKWPPWDFTLPRRWWGLGAPLPCLPLTFPNCCRWSETGPSNASFQSPTPFPKLAMRKPCTTPPGDRWTVFIFHGKRLKKSESNLCSR